jgi:hypothetical protein
MSFYDCLLVSYEYRIHKIYCTIIKILWGTVCRTECEFEGMKSRDLNGEKDGRDDESRRMKRQTERGE